MAHILEKWKIALAVAIFVVLALVRIAATHRVFNATVDEPFHISSGVQIYQELNYDGNFQNPPLAPAAIGILPYLNGLRLGPPADGSKARRVDLGLNEEYWRNISLARMGNIVFLPVLALVVYVWAARLHGEMAGLAAAALATFSPNLLAHAGLATTDFAAAATLPAAGYALCRWAESPRTRNGFIAALLCGLAIGTKFTAIGLLPLFAAVAFVAFRGRSVFGKRCWNLGNAARTAGSVLLFLAVTGAVVWALYGFDFRPLRDASMRPYARIDRLFAPGTALNDIGYRIAELPVPAAGFIDGFSRFSTYLGAGHARFHGGTTRQFLLGEVDSDRGWWYYFPLALALKTTLPFLLIAGLSLIRVLRRGVGKLTPAEICPITFAALVLLGSLFSSVNIGIRHILPIYPLAAIFASQVFAFSDGAFRYGRRTIVAGAALLLAHGAESALAHPDYLAYFNQIARGKEHLFLADSNLDWGQDAARLARYAADHRIRPLHVALISPDQAAIGLVDAVPFAAGERPTGWVAISVGYLQGVWNTGPSDYKWLLGHEPKARIGSSIWLYYIEP